MVEKIAFELVCPERLLFSDKVDMVTVPGEEGDYGVMFGHQPMITAVRPGLLEVDQGGGGQKSFFIDGGFAEVTGQTCAVMTEEAVPLDELKRNDIENRIKDLEIKIDNLKNDTELYLAEASLVVWREILAGASI